MEDHLNLPIPIYLLGSEIDFVVVVFEKLGFKLICFFLINGHKGAGKGIIAQGSNLEPDD